MEASLIIGDTLNLEQLVDLQGKCSFAQKKAISHELSKRITLHLEDSDIYNHYDNFQQRREIKKSVETLHLNGFIELGSRFNERQILETNGYFSQLPCYNAHLITKSDLVPRKLNADASNFPFGSFSMKDVIDAPNILELANAPEMLALASDYLGCLPTLYSLNAWWSFPGHEAEEKMTQGFHRDEDDFKNCVLFLYLTDTDEESGTHEYIRGTHRQDLTGELLENTSFPFINIGTNDSPQWVKVEFGDLFEGACYGGDLIYERIFGEQISPINGKAGDAFISDPSGLHRAKPPKTSPRLIVWIRYGYYENKAYQADGIIPVDFDWSLGRIPDSKLHRYINRLIVRA